MNTLLQFRLVVFMDPVIINCYIWPRRIKPLQVTFKCSEGGGGGSLLIYIGIGVGTTVKNKNLSVIGKHQIIRVCMQLMQISINLKKKNII